MDDHDLLLAIQNRLDGVEWSSDTLEEIAGLMVASGYRIRDLDDRDRSVPVIKGNFVLDGAPIDIGEFLRDEFLLSPEEVKQIAALQVGESMNLGGGAAPIFVLGREPEPDIGFGTPQGEG